MPTKASERLLRLNDKIMKTWEARAIKEVAAAQPNNSLALRNSLPEFLGQIAVALDTTVDRSTVRIRWEKTENTRIGKKHGRERAGEADYTMDQLIFEYHILRLVICDVMEEEAPLSDVEREVIICAVEQAVNDAATEFSQTLADIQERFTYALAHDLRGPLTGAKLGAQIILKTPADAAGCARVAARIVSSMDRLDAMIHDLLDASQIRTGGKLQMAREECDLDKILRQASEEANQLHGNRISFSTCGPTVGFWHEHGLRRVIDNLMSNAQKFSTNDTPITLKLTKSMGSVSFSIHNAGKAILDDEKVAIFQQFRRARTAENKAGWGLGLTVVKGITEALGGSVDVDSSEQKGTTFTVTLPLSSQASSSFSLLGKEPATN